MPSRELSAETGQAHRFTSQRSLGYAGSSRFRSPYWHLLLLATLMPSPVSRLIQVARVAQGHCQGNERSGFVSFSSSSRLATHADLGSRPTLFNRRHVAFLALE